MVTHTYNSSAQKAEAGGLQIQGQPRLSHENKERGREEGGEQRRLTWFIGSIRKYTFQNKITGNVF